MKKIRVPSSSGTATVLLSLALTVTLTLAVGLTLAATLTASSAASAPAAPARVGLGTADPFAVLAGSTVTNTGPSILNGDLGLSPGTAVTGFPPGIVAGTQHRTDAVALQAQEDLTTAYNDAAGRSPTGSLSNLGGQTLVGGVYKADAAMALTGTLTLDAQGNRDTVFIFQAGSTLITASNSRVRLIGAAQACNVFWQVGSSATLGTSTRFVGTIMALTTAILNTNAKVEGRVLARNGAVTLDTNVISRPGCAAAPTAPPTTAPPTTAPPTTAPPTTAPPTTAPPTTAPPTTAPPTTPPPTTPPPTTPPPTTPPPTTAPPTTAPPTTPGVPTASPTAPSPSEAPVTGGTDGTAGGAGGAGNGGGNANGDGAGNDGGNANGDGAGNDGGNANGNADDGSGNANSDSNGGSTAAGSNEVSSNGAGSNNVSEGIIPLGRPDTGRGPVAIPEAGSPIGWLWAAAALMGLGLVAIGATQSRTSSGRHLRQR